jgi:hypothetical protein
VGENLTNTIGLTEGNPAPSAPSRWAPFWRARSLAARWRFPPVTGSDHGDAKAPALPLGSVPDPPKDRFYTTVGQPAARRDPARPGHGRIKP